MNESDITVKPNVKLGIEYLVLLEKYVIPFGLGTFYETMPAYNNTSKYSGLSFGTGISNNKYTIQMSYLYKKQINKQKYDYSNQSENVFSLTSFWYFK